MIGVVTWLLGSQLGRQVFIWGSVVVLAGLIVLRIYAAGRASEKARQAEQSLRNLRERAKVDDEITRMPADARRERLREWVQRDPG